MAGGSAAAARQAGYACSVAARSRPSGALPAQERLTAVESPGGARMDLKQQIAADLDEARGRTHELLGPLDDERLTTQYDQLMSPPVLDYAHIGVFEELWLVQRLSGAPPLDEELMATYDAIETPRVVRGRRRLLDRSQSTSYVGQVRSRTLALLEEVDLDAGDPLLRGGFVYNLVVQHENQHDETILQTLQLTPGLYRRELPGRPDAPIAPGARDGMVAVTGGRYRVAATLTSRTTTSTP